MCRFRGALRLLPSVLFCGHSEAKATSKGASFDYPGKRSYNRWVNEQCSQDNAGLVASVRRLIGGIMSDSPPARPNPNEKLVRVFDTEQESEALVVHGLLESSGIDSDITSLDAQQDILPGVGGTIILVREEDAAKAHRVIEEYRQAPGSDETAEIDISGIPED
jgi:hypothetical protein